MLIYDRRRCRPAELEEMRGRLSLAQRARLGVAEQAGWQLLFVRGEPSVAYLRNELGFAVIARDGRFMPVRSLPQRGDGIVAARDEAMPIWHDVETEPQRAAAG